MCGIFAVVGAQKNAAQVVLSGLKKLEYRGYDSWGIAVQVKEQIKLDRHVGKIGQAKVNLPASNIALGHTRWATHGGVTVGNSHPHLDCSKKLCLVHNGIVENFRPLKEKLIKNHQFKSQTDTEVALHLIEEKAKTMPILKAFRSSFRQLHGMNALILLTAAQNQLLAVKNGSPLTIGLGKNETYISSDVWALLHHTNRVVFLEDNQLARLTASGLELFDVNTNRRIEPKIHRLDWQKEQSRLGKFHHYMEKEIFDQPHVLDNLSRLDESLIRQVSHSIKKSAKSYILGCGTAAYAALFGEYLFNFLGYDVESIVGSEFKKNLNLLSPDNSFILLSQSGETIDVIEAVDLAKAKGVTIIGITNVLGSTLYRKSDQKITLKAGQEVAVASTKAFTAKLAVLIQVAFLLKKELPKGRQLIADSALAVKNLAAGGIRQKIKLLAQKIKDQEHLFVIGRLLSYPIALETALKIKEVSYIHAEGFPAGELKHGPIALIDQGIPCLVIAPNDSTFTDVISAAHELKARGGFIVGLSPKNDPVFDFHLKVPDLQQATAIPMTAIAQLLAYDLAVARGLNPDKPRNLAKSVTVK